MGLATADVWAGAPAVAASRSQAASRPCCNQPAAAQLCRAQCWVVEHVRQRRRRQVAGGAARAPPEVAAAPAPPPAELQAAASELLGLEVQPGSGGNPIDASLARHDGDIIDFFFRQYNLGARKQVRGRAARALAALQATEPSVSQLSLERDVLPKLELLEALSPRLGWKVFSKYPEQFAAPDAIECWRLMAAFLFTSGMPPQRITALFQAQPSLFKHSVQRPDQMRRLFAWLQHGLGLQQGDVVKLITRCPIILQTDVEVLQARVQLLADLGLPQDRVATGVVRNPEVLGVDSALLQAKVAFLMGEVGLSASDVGQMFVRDPAALLGSLPTIQEKVAWLREGLGLEGDLLLKVVAKGGAVKYPLATLQGRVAFWCEGLGFSLPELHTLLRRVPRLLLYPMRELKYQLKLAFLEEGLGLSEEEARAALLAFPAYITYSLPGRIAPRAAAATALAGTSLPLGQLALGDDAFARWLGVDAGQYHEWQAEWRRSSDAAQWLEAGDEEAG